MQGSDRIIEFLNEALTAELTAINQYFAHAKLCENWGWSKLAAKYREESIEEMHDAEKLMDRILLLDGMPNLQRLGTVRVGETPMEQFEVDKVLEEEAIERYRRGVQLALEDGDPGTRELLEHLVVGHLSEKNNTPLLARDALLSVSPGLASRLTLTCQDRAKMAIASVRIRQAQLTISLAAKTIGSSVICPRWVSMITREIQNSSTGETSHNTLIRA